MIEAVNSRIKNGGKIKKIKKSITKRKYGKSITKRKYRIFSRGHLTINNIVNCTNNLSINMLCVILKNSNI